MSEIVLTQYNGSILGPIARFLGWIMNGIYYVIENVFHIQNIGVGIVISIVIMTLLIYACLFPLTYKQQKFSKLSQKMNPELREIQDKYKGKRDQASMAKMQEETQMVYQKYGVSPTGSCVQLLIQMPILFALYRVFMNIPAYIGLVKDKFTGVVEAICSTDGFAQKMTDLVSNAKIAGLGVDFSLEQTAENMETIKNYIIDVLYKLDTNGWDLISKSFPNVDFSLESKLNLIEGFNISNSPWYIIKTNIADFSAAGLLLIVLALLIPVLSFITQRLNIKLMPTAAASDNDAMARQMKTMNLMMPLFSFVMCFTVPVGLGIYWIASALIRGIQQFGINKHMDKLDWDEILKENQEKAREKREKKMGLIQNQIANAARVNTRSSVNMSSNLSDKERENILEQADEIKSKAREGSMASIANRVREYNERNNK